MSKIAKVKPYTIENGDGIRVSIFFSGCEHYCKDCFNSELWDFNIGETFSREYYENKIKPLIKDYINGISLIGGEPFHPKNFLDTYRLIHQFFLDFPGKTIWVYTGYEYEYLHSSQYLLELCEATQNRIPTTFLLHSIFYYIHVLVDGKFIEEKKQLRLAYRGSTNQRIIDVQKSLRENKVILYKE